MFKISDIPKKDKEVVKEGVKEGNKGVEKKRKRKEEKVVDKEDKDVDTDLVKDVDKGLEKKIKRKRREDKVKNIEMDKEGDKDMDTDVVKDVDKEIKKKNKVVTDVVIELKDVVKDVVKDVDTVVVTEPNVDLDTSDGKIFVSVLNANKLYDLLNKAMEVFDDKTHPKAIPPKVVSVANFAIKKIIEYIETNRKDNTKRLSLCDKKTMEVMFGEELKNDMNEMFDNCLHIGIVGGVEFAMNRMIERKGWKGKEEWKGVKKDLKMVRDLPRLLSPNHEK